MLGKSQFVRFNQVVRSSLTCARRVAASCADLKAPSGGKALLLAERAPEVFVAILRGLVSELRLVSDHLATLTSPGELIQAKLCGQGLGQAGTDPLLEDGKNMATFEEKKRRLGEKKVGLGLEAGLSALGSHRSQFSLATSVKVYVS